MKHAYLIMAHSNIVQLKWLCQCLDDDRNDIYLHIDRKFDISDEDLSLLKNSIKQSNLFFVSRMNVSWGAFSLVECELNLLRSVLRNQIGYSYLHLLSGQDLPIKSQDYIHNYFNDHQGEEFIDYKNDEWLNEVSKKVRCYYPFQEIAGKVRNANIREGLYFFQKVIVKIQELINVDRMRGRQLKLFGGAEWFSITSDCAQYIIDHASDYLDFFRMTSCSDEFLLQTIIGGSPFYNSIHKSDIMDGCHQNMRLTIWERGMHPKTLTMEDAFSISSSDLLFARKFDKNVDNKIISLVIQLVDKGYILNSI